jgi:hypothetical protein
MVLLLGAAAVSALLTIMLFAAARYAWRAASNRRRRPRPYLWPRPGPDADAAVRRHPAGRGRHATLVPGDLAGTLSAQWPAPTGPDDDPEFIDALERLIRGDGDDTFPM